MRLGGARSSSNIEDRRGIGGAGMIGGGGIGMLILVLIISFLTGTNPLELMQQVEQTAPQSSAPTGAPAADDPQAQFVARVLADTEDTWNRVFAQSGKRYEEPILVLFDGQVRSACGFASAAVGPFYCPGDHKLYLDMSFFRELDKLRRAGRLRAGLRHRARSRPSRADAARHLRAGPQRPPARRRKRRPTRCRCGWSCRPIAWPASGVITRSRSSCSSRATSKKGSGPPRPSATTGCSDAVKGRSCRSPSRTDRRSSASAG